MVLSNITILPTYGAPRWWNNIAKMERPLPYLRVQEISRQSEWILFSNCQKHAAGPSCWLEFIFRSTILTNGWMIKLFGQDQTPRKLVSKSFLHTFWPHHHWFVVFKTTEFSGCWSFPHPTVVRLNFLLVPCLTSLIIQFHQGHVCCRLQCIDDMECPFIHLRMRHGGHNQIVSAQSSSLQQLLELERAGTQISSCWDE